MTRTYEAAITSLNSLQTNYAIVEAFKKSKTRQQINDSSLPETVEWLKRIGYKPSDLNRLNAIHVAGTKGKGSTSAFISTILSQYTRKDADQPGSNLKIGLYTSPHLRFARERIKINNAPLSEEQFARYFFEVWDRLEDSAKLAGEDPAMKPQYFRYLTVMAFHTYLSEGVDAAVIECGIGGQYDCTNVIPQPKVTAISSLGIDHVDLLGHTLEEIAWHKGGILKRGVNGFAAPQPLGAEQVLAKRAEEAGAKLEIVAGHSELRPESSKITPGLAGDFQYTNASVAVAVAADFLRQVGIDVPDDIMKAPLPAKFKTGLEETRLGGRCETRFEKNVSWYIDGGHTLESIRLAGQWFASRIKADSSSDDVAAKKTRILIFNQQTRNSTALAHALHETLASALGNGTPFTHALFCTNITYKQSGFRPDLVSMNTNADDLELLRVQKSLAVEWNAIDPQAKTHVFGTIEEAVDFAREIAGQERKVLQKDEAPVMTFVTGSIHLVGGFLDVVETKPPTDE
ncbi:Folylpolyglutamate synthase, eukaryota [Penicillium griseofulvum]|uniref:Folylpolyglutamate synthase n=1 Tax=Penicillium patulum TaxID=5078 RepID=A0A135LXQ2_PENPA|nr:Folylpolyglutamate synthase, eukaryota [Penicillium griseofulvum]KXG53749.1 Folylpolyglutamate synthase, eukaryota [Penicillium griseofulvum]